MATDWLERTASRPFLIALGGAFTLAACSTQPAYQHPLIATASAWSNATPTANATAPLAVPITAGDRWWTQLHDPAINDLTAVALADNPTLAEAAANIDESRATLAEAGAQRLPSISATGSASRSLTANPLALGGASFGAGSAGGSSSLMENSASIGPSLSWEIDLWGRLRETAQAARDRLDASNAEAREARLSLAAQIADGVLSLRACNYSESVRDQDLASRQTELDLMRKRLAYGNVAPVDLADAETNLASAQTDRISQEETCARRADALATLSGRDPNEVLQLVSRNGTDNFMPVPPRMQPQLPASVLLEHPSVVSAEREAAARWSEIGVARAERLPQIDLSALLSGNWLSAAGSTLTYEAWSAGLSLSAPLFDGGAGAAKVRGAQASYRAAVANLRLTVRTASQNVEDALAAQQSAEQRVVTSQQAVNSGLFTLRANEARWRAGSITLFDLEDARRQFNSAQESAIAAARDRAQAWVGLVQATGSAPSTPTDTSENNAG